VRPLLTVRRAEVLAYLKRLGQAYRDDKSNWDRRYTRNRLRHDVLPRLAEEFNPALVDVLCRLAEQAGEMEAYVAGQAAQLLKEAELPRAGTTVVLDARRLGEAPPLLVREALRLLWEREGWPEGEMGFDAWQRAAAVVAGTETAVDFPGGVRLRRVGHVVQAASG